MNVHFGISRIPSSAQQLKTAARTHTLLALILAAVLSCCAADEGIQEIPKCIFALALFCLHFHLRLGVPQETVLNPTLLFLYLDGIEKTISPGTRIGMFADDIVLWNFGNTFAEIEFRPNSSLKALSVFAGELKLSFNSTTSITTFFTTNEHLYSYQLSLMLNHQKLIYEKHPQYVGFILDPEFTSSKHIEHIILKARYA